jgi:hydrogenase maturation protease
MTTPLTVIGVGDRDRGDDAIGPIIADAARARFGDAISTIVVEGDVTRLPTSWPRDHHVVLIDAVHGTAASGTLHIMDGPAAIRTRSAGWSTQGVGIGDVIERARVLDVLPERLTVIGVESARFEHGDPPSPAVLAAVRPALEAIRVRLEEVDAGVRVG